MKRFLIQFITLITVIFGVLAYSTGKLPSLPASPSSTKPTHVTIKNSTITVELADTADKKKKGLGGRESLVPDTGMLFIYQKADFYNFWMKGTKIPLDMIWIKDTTIVDITKNAMPPKEGQKDTDLPIYTPKEKADKILEVTGGYADAKGIIIGEKIEIKK